MAPRSVFIAVLASGLLESSRALHSGRLPGRMPHRTGQQRITSLRAAAADDSPTDDIDSMLVTEMNNVINMLKARGGAKELDLSDSDLEAMRVRGEMLFADLGADINASFANVSATLSKRIAAEMAEERITALNSFNEKTAAIQREVQEGREQVRENMRRVAEIEASVQTSGGSDLGRRSATAVASVAVLLGLYNGGVSLWSGLAFEGAPQSDVINGSLDLVGAAIGAFVLWRISSSDSTIQR